MAQLVRNLPAVWETSVWSLGVEDSPGEGKGYLSPPVFWPREFHGLYIVHGVTKSRTQTEQLSLSTSPPVTLPSVVSHYCSSIKNEIMNGLYSQGYSLPSCHLWLSELDHKEGKMPKNWCLRSVVLEKTTEVPCTAKSNQSILREIKPEYSLEGLMLKLKLQYFGHLMWIHNSGKAPEAGKDWGQKEKRASEDEMTGWHHQCNEYELSKLGEGQGGLGCCSPWDHKEWHDWAAEQQQMNEIQNVCLAVAYSMLVCKDHRSTKCQYVKDPWNGIIVANKVAT